MLYKSAGPLSLAFIVLSFAFGSPAQAQKQVTVNSFKSSTLWPVWAAQKQGFFAKEGLTIKNVYTPNSVSQMVGLINGEFDLITTALDNVIAYDEGEGSPKAPKQADLIAFMGGTNGALSLIARPGIKSIKELKGRDLAVDAISTGYSFVLQEILAKNGVKPGDYKLVPFGNTGARFAALKAEKAVAGLLSPPLSQAAVAQGYVDLADAADALGGYQGTVSATRRDYARKNPDVIVDYIRAYRAGLEWLRAPANKQAAIDILRGEINGISAKAGEEAYNFLVANPKGFDAGGKIDPAGARHVLELRRQYGPKGKPATDIGRFIDETYFTKATKS